MRPIRGASPRERPPEDRRTKELNSRRPNGEFGAPRAQFIWEGEETPVSSPCGELRCGDARFFYSGVEAALLHAASEVLLISRGARGARKGKGQPAAGCAWPHPLPRSLQNSFWPDVRLKGQEPSACQGWSLGMGWGVRPPLLTFLLWASGARLPTPGRRTPKLLRTEFTWISSRRPLALIGAGRLGERGTPKKLPTLASRPKLPPADAAPSESPWKGFGFASQAAHRRHPKAEEGAPRKVGSP